MRSLRRALLWASVAGIWFGCSVNQSGLTDAGGVNADGSGGAAGGSGGNPAGRGGSGGSTGGPTGTAGSSAGAGGRGVAGTNGVAGAGGMTTGDAGSGGSGATAGSGGSGAFGGGGAGNPGIAGSVGGGGAGIGGIGGSTAGSAGGTTGTAGNGGNGSTAGTGGDGAGGDGASGGRGGRGGTGPTGTAGTNGRGGMGGRGGGPGGRGGNGGNPCSMYPSARAFTPPTDTRVHCYWARTSSQTWSEAQQSCNIQNGYLVSILSAEENAFVVSMAAFSSSFNDTWIGATDTKSGGDRTGPGTYRWVSSETWGYTSWESGQPDGFCDPCSTGQTCTCDHRAVLASDGTWNDRWQDNSRSSVCEAVPN